MLLIISLAISIGSIVCWVLTLVKLFQAGKTLEGVLSICPLIGFILGWVRAKELNHTKVMMIWSVLVVLSILINVMFASTAPDLTPAVR
ncbi:MAG: hypothetical protein H7144_18025 [Burkholderiales bacterium]|nr:hypothetical protein [Phycisphaerae bacterium]